MPGGTHHTISNVTVVLAPGADSVASAIEELVARLRDANPTLQASCLDAVRSREAQASTYFGHGLALPHARCSAPTPWVVAFARYSDGLAWGPAGERAQLVFLSLIPATAATDYLRFLQKLGRAIRDDPAREALLAAPDEDAVRHWMRTHLRIG